RSSGQSTMAVRPTPLQKSNNLAAASWTSSTSPSAIRCRPQSVSPWRAVNSSRLTPSATTRWSIPASNAINAASTPGCDSRWRGADSAMTLTVTYSDRAPRVYGPYSQAIIAGDLIYTSGQIPLDPVSMEVVAGGIEEQATQAIANLRAVLQTAGSDLDRVVKTTVFLVDLA